MRAVVSALIIVGLFLLIACGENDKNVINPIAKYHDADPTFRIMVDNGYKKFPIDSVRMFIDPYLPGFQISRNFSDTTFYKYYHRETDLLGKTIFIEDSVKIGDIKTSSGTFDIPSLGADDPASIPIYTNHNGFAGILEAGTYLADIHTYIDTLAFELDTLSGVVLKTDTVRAADTTAGVHHMTPGQVYTISLVRENDFDYLDTLKIIHSISVDSSWLLRSADTIRVSKKPDLSMDPITTVDSVTIFETPPAAGDEPDSEYYEPAWFGVYSDTAFMILKITDESQRDSLNLNQDTWGFWKLFYDTVYVDSVHYGYWEHIDSFFLPADSSYWCTGDSIKIRKYDTTRVHPSYSDTLTRIDTTIYYYNCDAAALKPSSLKTVIYRDYIWGIYPGGDPRRTPIEAYDTVQHYALLDSSKTIEFLDGYMLQLVSTIPDPDVTRPVSIYLNMISSLDPNTTTKLDSLKFNIVIPPNEVYPDFKIVIKDEN